jgi:two-component system, chemotaxis family, chemotaxis protein CheY
MSSYLFESGLRQVAQALIVMHAPTSHGIERSLDELRLLGQDSAHIERPDISRAAGTAEDTVRELLLTPTEDAHTHCVRALVELGQMLLLALAADAEHPVQSSETSPQMERRLLVVDDSRVSATAISKAFALQGFLVRTVATMVDALAEMTTFMPSILVSDVYMPDLDVGVLCRNFRILARDRPHLVVLVSSSSGPDLETRVSEVKPDGFVSKMSGTAPVLDCVMKLWQQRQKDH